MRIPSSLIALIVPIAASVAACSDPASNAASDAADDVADDTVGSVDSNVEADTTPSFDTSPPPECSADQACAALESPPACQAWACLDGSCERIPVDDGTACVPADRCLLPGTCQGGFCISGGDRACGDQNPCTADSCDPATGCVSVADPEGVCDDGDSCTLGDRCEAGACVAGTPMACDDGNACTANDRCEDGACTSDEVEACDDGDPCTSGDACDPLTGACVGIAAGTCECQVDADCLPLEDGDACNGTLVCGDDFSCQLDPATVVTCTASTVACQDVVCDPGSGVCLETPAAEGAPCVHAGNPCLLPSVCDAGGICGLEIIDCDDGDSCTADLCVNGSCEHAADPNCGCPTPPCGPENSTPGDALTPGSFSFNVVETVGMTSVDELVVTCGGFGMDLFDASSGQLTWLTNIQGVPRCQNVEVGPTLPTGEIIIFASNHGDAYSPAPAIFTVVVDPSDDFAVTFTNATIVSDISVEGLAWDAAAGSLLVAAHSHGVLRYAMVDTGVLELDGETDDNLFSNAWRLAIAGNMVAVADGGSGLRLLNRVDLSTIAVVGTAGFAKDVVVINNLAYVAVSSLGVEVWSIADPFNPTLVQTIFTHGSTLDLAKLGGGSHVAVANWQDLTVIATSTGNITATDRGGITAKEPRVLAVTASGARLFFADWLGVGELVFDPTLAAPQIHVDRRTIALPSAAPGAVASVTLGVSNHGHLPLTVPSIVASTADWSISPSNFVLQPGESIPVNVSFTGTGTTSTFDLLSIASNDPDESLTTLTLWSNISSTGLAVGGQLDSRFDFLDVGAPEPDQSIANLSGNILVLAYFATF